MLHTLRIECQDDLAEGCACFEEYIGCSDVTACGKEVIYSMHIIYNLLGLWSRYDRHFVGITIDIE